MELTKIDKHILKEFHDKYAEEISNNYHWMTTLGIDILDDYREKDLEFIERHANARSCLGFRVNYYKVKGARTLYLRLLSYIEDTEDKLRKKQKRKGKNNGSDECIQDVIGD